MFAGNVLFHTIIDTGKKNFTKIFLQSFQVTKCCYAIIAIKHDFLIHVHLHLLGPEGGAEALKDSGFKTRPGAQQILMHTCRK